jgi:hypothetical protein
MARVPLIAAALAALALAGCSLKSSGGQGVPASGVKSNEGAAAQQLGFPTTATKNTTRVPGQDPATDAAGVASAVFPAISARGRPPSRSWTRETGRVRWQRECFRLLRPTHPCS